MRPVAQEGLVHDPDDSVMTEVESTVTLSGDQAAVLDALLSALHDLM